MADITEGLDRIRKVFAAYTPHRVKDIGVGLALEKIEEITRNLHFILPPEVYELYQWGNGLSWNFLFENYEFLSLKLAIQCYQEELSQAKADYPEIAEFFQYRFPIFQLWCDSGVLLTVAPLERKGSPIYGFDVEFNDYTLRYYSLTDLILHSAEWYETATFEDRDNTWKIDNLYINIFLMEAPHHCSHSKIGIRLETLNIRLNFAIILYDQLN
jgi:hypothetical protein